MNNVDKLRQELIDLVYKEIGEDRAFDIEAGFTPQKDRAEEIVDDGILSLAWKYNAFIREAE